MWEVKRFNNKNSFDEWFYCKDCFIDRDELLLELDSDSYPYGIYPIDSKIKKNKDSWCISIRDKNRGLYKNLVSSKKRNRVKIQK